jgi:uncharacterized protein
MPRLPGTRHSASREPAPFIRKFATRGRRYIYDVNTNHILAVDSAVFAIVDDIHRLGPDAIVGRWSGQFGESAVRCAMRELRGAIRQGLFRVDRPAEIRPYGGEPVERHLGGRCDHLILSVTDDCNLRCRYCVYGGGYPNQRTHSSFRMTREIAEKAIDYFVARSRRVKEPHLGFYGGEPLLNLPLVRHTVEYLESRTKKRYRYGLTTNGVLLRGEAADFVAGRDFDLLVSIDGSPSQHDRFRVDRRGRGTWDSVMANVVALHERWPKYVETHVSISAVVTSERDLAAARAFFEGHPLLSRLNVTSSYPVYTNSAIRPAAGTDACEDGDDECAVCGMFEAGETSMVENGTLSPYMKGFFQRELMNIHFRPITRTTGKSIHINGCCLPGERRLFVRSDGSLFPCERLDYGYPIGHIDTGVDPRAVRALVDEYAALSKPCLDCWAVRFCTKCFASCCSEGRLDPEVRARECAAYRRELENIFVMYHEVIERRPRALHWLNKMTVS